MVDIKIAGNRLPILLSKASNGLDCLQVIGYDVSIVKRNNHYEGNQDVSDYEANTVKTGIEHFDALYDNLATAWVSHEELRRAHTPLPQLAASSEELDRARTAMWSWWKMNRIEQS